jgi:hypothetical protein
VRELPLTSTSVRLTRACLVVSALAVAVCGCGRVTVSVDAPLLDLASPIQRSAAQLVAAQPGATANVEQSFQVTSGPTVIVIAPEGGIDRDALHAVAPQSTEALARMQPEPTGRPIVAMVSGDRVTRTPIEGVTVSKQLLVTRGSGRTHITVFLRREANGVVIYDMK